MGTAIFLPVFKWSEREVDNSPPTVAHIKNV